MPSVVALVPIKPGKLNINGFYQTAVKALNAEALVHRRTLTLTTRTWRHERPIFVTDLDRFGTGIAATTYPSRSPFGVKKWRWLEKGTKKRYAVLSRDWRSKTRVRYLGSGPGAGHVILRGAAARRLFALQHRRPPKIKARMWRDTMIRVRIRIFPRNVQNAFNLAARRAF